MTKKLNNSAKHVAKYVGMAAALALAALTAPVASAQGAQGMRVAKDAVTGELRALTAEEHKALDAKGAPDAGKGAGLKRAAAAAPAKSEPTLIKHNGSAKVYGARMSDELMSQSVVVRMADGSLQEVCTDPSHSHTVVKALQSTTKTSPIKALETE